MTCSLKYHETLGLCIPDIEDGSRVPIDFQEFGIRLLEFLQNQLQTKHLS